MCERNQKNYNLHLLKSCTFAGTFQMPRLLPYNGMMPEVYMPIDGTTQKVRKETAISINTMPK